MKKVCAVLVSLMLFATMATSAYTSYTQKTSGSYTTVTPVTDRARDWMLAQFGACETVPELLAAIDAFGCENFVYEDWNWGLVQHYDLERFLFREDYHGVCFDFSCFVKCVVTVWSEAHGRDDVQAFVYDVHLKKGANHSYNFIREEGHTWFLCLTSNVSVTSKGKPSYGFSEVPHGDVEACLARWGDRKYNVN